MRRLPKKIEVQPEDESLEMPMKIEPSGLDMENTYFSVDRIVAMLQDGSLFLPPYLQVLIDSWSSSKKSQLIESLILGIPIQSFLFSEEFFDGRLTIIDGFCRLCAIKDFFWGPVPLELSGLRYLVDCNGKTRSTLPLPYLRRILQSTISVGILRRDTPIAMKYAIFQSVQGGDARIFPQSMRMRLNAGVSFFIIERMVHMPSFRKVLLKYSFSEWDVCEFVLRFLAFFIYGEKYVGYYNLFLDSAMKRLNSMDKVEHSRIMRRFDSSMMACAKLFDSDAFVFEGKWNKSLWDCFSVSIAKMSQTNQLHLAERKEIFLSEYGVLLESRRFCESITKRSLDPKQVKYRFMMVDKLLNRVL